MRLSVSMRLSRAESRERTRQELLEAAASVFAEKGFAGASVDDVAESAGYTKGAVYSNFASKTDLMLALIEDRIRRQSEMVEAAFAGVTLEEGLRDLEARRPGSAAIDRDWMMLVGEFMLYALRDERARVALAAEYERARGLSAAMVAAKYEESGAVPPLPPRDIAIIIESLGIGLGFQALIDPAGVSLDLQAVAVERLLGGGAPGPGAATQPPKPPPPPRPGRPPKPGSKGTKAG